MYNSGKQRHLPTPCLSDANATNGGETNRLCNYSHYSYKVGDRPLCQQKQKRHGYIFIFIRE